MPTAVRLLLSAVVVALVAWFALDARTHVGGIVVIFAPRRGLVYGDLGAVVAGLGLLALVWRRR